MQTRRKKQLLLMLEMLYLVCITCIACELDLLLDQYIKYIYTDCCVGIKKWMLIHINKFYIIIITASHECQRDATLYFTRELININDFIIKFQSIYGIPII